MPFGELVIFGDSLSDTGNVFAQSGSPPPPYFEGRFSNGPVWIEHVANRLGLKEDAAALLLGGNNYAFGGARVQPGLAAVPSLTEQVGMYLGNVGVANPDALYVVVGGGNDMRDAFSLAIQAQQLAAQGLFAEAQAALEQSTEIATNAVTLLGEIMGGLAAAGAGHILVANLPNLGLIPSVSAFGAAAVVAATEASVAFNFGLAQTVGFLSSIFSDTSFISFDTFAFFNNLVFNPALHGFENVADACLTAAGVCADPDKYVFWDGIHGTARTNQLFGSAAFDVLPVPEPATLTLMLIGLFGLRRATR